MRGDRENKRCGELRRAYLTDSCNGATVIPELPFEIMRKKVKIPKGVKPKVDQIHALTRRIGGLAEHFAHGAERFHDGRAKRLLERFVGKRGLALAALREQDPELYQKLIAEISGKGGASERNKQDI